MNTKRSLRRCPCCGTDLALVLHTMKFTLPADSPLPSEYDLVGCNACGNCFADTPGSQAQYDFYYAEFSKYESETLASGSGAEPEDALRLKEMARTLAGLVAATTRVLDIGAANGGLMIALRELGFTRLGGLDPSPRCVEVMRKAGFAAECGTLSEVATDDTAAHDLVVLSHVLEHVVDLHAALRAVQSRLVRGGLLYVEVPDAGAYIDHPRAPFYYFDSEHINHFNAVSLRELLRRAGYVTIDAGHKHLMLADGAPYPAVWVLARLAPEPARESAARFDFALRDSLLAYIAQSEAASSHDLIDQCAASGRPVVIWGAGQNTMRLLQASSLSRCNIVAIVDGDTRKQGQSFAGHTVRAPQTLAGLAELDRLPPALVLISAAIHGRRISTELAQIRPEQPFALV